MQLVTRTYDITQSNNIAFPPHPTLFAYFFKASGVTSGPFADRQSVVALFGIFAVLPLCLLKDLRCVRLAFPPEFFGGFGLVRVGQPERIALHLKRTEGVNNTNEPPPPSFLFVSCSKLSYTSGVSVLADVLLTLIVLFAGAQEARWAFQQHPQTIKPCFLAALCFNTVKGVRVAR